MKLWRRWLAIVLAGLLVAPQTLPTWIGLPVAAPLAIGFVLSATGDADARSSGGGGRSSGGYSRPSSSGSSSRTPSLSGNSSSSGGYTRPGAAPSEPSRTPTLSARDRDTSRAESRKGLSDFERRQTPPTPPPTTANGPVQPPRTANSQNSTGGGSISAPNWRSSRDDRRPSYIPSGYSGPARFGLLEAGMLFLLVNSLSKPANAEFFHHHAQDPDYLSWRAEADQLAKKDPELRAKLAEVDRVIAERKDQPRNPRYMPDDKDKDEGGNGWLILLGLLIIGGLIFWLIRSRRNRTAPATAGAGTGTPTDLGSSMIRNKLSGARYRPDYLRLGMGVTLDPSPFILLGPSTTVPTPEGGGGTVSVTALSIVSPAEGSSPEPDLFWLTVGDGRFVEVSLSPQGRPQESRYFGKIDEVYPANADEWEFWLGKTDGMIGWPEFQTKDGQTYRRQWLPGGTRIPPRRLIEARERADGTNERKLHAMLYARATGLAKPAPQTEYLLVLAAETPDEAWVELYVGIDLPPSSLGFA